MCHVEDTQRQNSLTAFNNMLRLSDLAGVVDLQRTAMVFSALMEQTPEDQGLPLGFLYDFLLEQKAPAEAVAEMLVFLHSREERIGLKMDLPPKLAELSEEDRNKLILLFAARGQNSGAQPTKSPEPPIQAPSANAANPRPEGPYAKNRKNNNTSKSTTRLAVVAFSLLATLVGNRVYLKMTSEPGPVPLRFNDPGGLPCLIAEGTKGIAMCTVSKAFADKTDVSVFAAKGSLTAAAARALGYKQVMVFSQEDSKLRQIF